MAPQPPPKPDPSRKPQVLQKSGAGSSSATNGGQAAVPPQTAPRARRPSENAAPTAPAQPGTVVYPYAAVREDELTVEPGMSVDVLETSDDGWILCELRGGSLRGWLPQAYVDTAAAGPYRAAVAPVASTLATTHDSNADIVVALYEVPSLISHP